VVAERTRETSPRTAAILLGLMLFALAVHLPARMGDLYGEQDLARLVNSALLWTRAGVRTEALSEYEYYTSPAYIWLITLLLPGTHGALAPAAAALNTINLIVAVVITVPVYLLFRRLAGAQAALIATLFLSIMPAFWQGGLYGFPTLPAALFMVLAVWLFDRWLVGDGGPRARAPALVACCLCLTAGIVLKADVYLGAVALWGLLLYRRRWSWRNAAVVALAGAAPVAILYGVSTALLQQSPGAFVYAGTWSRSYPVEPGTALTAANALQVVKSFGLLSLPVFAVALVMLVRERQYGLAATLLTWAALPVAFWIGRSGDSARHHLQSTIPVALGVGLVLTRLPIRSAWRYVALALLAAVNYSAFAPSSSTRVTSGNLIRSAQMTARRVAVYHRLARSYAGQDAPRTAFLGTFTDPFAENQVFSLADSVTGVRSVVRFGMSAEEIEYLRHGRHHVSVIVELPDPIPPGGEAAAVAAAYRETGYAVYSMEDLGDRGRRYPSRRDSPLSELQLR
jgi:4-amino-4-deoxy-L-arabinose transferase-like glycosyltransferase